MPKEEITIESWRFTNSSAFIRELSHLLEFSDYRIVARVRAEEVERLIAELDSIRGLGRLKVRIDEKKL